MDRVVVIVPTYNEAENLPRLLGDLGSLQAPPDVLVVDDDSPDGTGGIADSFAARDGAVHVLHRVDEKRGYAKASIAGMQWALARDYGLVCTMDADLSHDPRTLPDLTAAVSNGASMAIGSRYVAGGGLEVTWGPVRRAVSRSGSRYAAAMLGCRVHDCTSGYRCYRRDVLEAVPFEALRSEGYSFLIEVLRCAISSAGEIVEVPITYVDRTHGQSKISRQIVWEALMLTTRMGFERLRGGA